MDRVLEHWMEREFRSHRVMRAMPGGIEQRNSRGRMMRWPEQELEIPRRVAIIMDGNGRWATSRGMPRIEGHREGEKAITDTVSGWLGLELEALTLYAFSTENWKRPTEEVRFLMSFNRELLDQPGGRVPREEREDKVHRAKRRAAGVPLGQDGGDHGANRCEHRA